MLFLIMQNSISCPDGGIGRLKKYFHCVGISKWPISENFEFFRSKEQADHLPVVCCFGSNSHFSCQKFLGLYF